MSALRHNRLRLALMLLLAMVSTLVGLPAGALRAAAACASLDTPAIRVDAVDAARGDRTCSAGAMAGRCCCPGGSRHSAGAHHGSAAAVVTAGGCGCTLQAPVSAPESRKEPAAVPLAFAAVLPAAPPSFLPDVALTTSSDPEPAGSPRAAARRAGSSRAPPASLLG